MLTALRLARMHSQSLYQMDSKGRIVRVREPEPDPPPRFTLTRTGHGHIALVRHDVPAGIAALLLGLADREPPLDDPLQPPAQLEGYIAALSKLRAVQRTCAGPAFVLPRGQGVSLGTTRISKENGTLLERHFPWTFRQLQVRSPVWAVVEDGAAVAICYAAREPSLGIEAGVFTVEGWRGRGYAQRVVASWAHDLWEQGRVPLYSTWWENTASLRIAERLGGVLFAVDFSLT